MEFYYDEYDLYREARNIFDKKQAYLCSSRYDKYSPLIEFILDEANRMVPYHLYFNMFEKILMRRKHKYDTDKLFFIDALKIIKQIGNTRKGLCDDVLPLIYSYQYDDKMVLDA